jgi:hypothetical protein
MHNLTRADFDGQPARILRLGVAHKADLIIYRLNGEDVLLKDYARKRGMWREVLGVMLTRQEAKALQALRGVRGVPQFRGRPDRYCVAMTFVSADQARRANPRLQNNEGFVRELRRLVRKMHGRGVVHLDLKHRSNLIAAVEGTPVVLDFESALCFNPHWVVGQVAVKLLGQLDWLAVHNWTRRLCPAMIASSGFDAGAARLAHGSRRLWFLRRIADVFVDIFAAAERKNSAKD